MPTKKQVEVIKEALAQEEESTSSSEDDDNPLKSKDLAEENDETPPKRPRGRPKNPPKEKKPLSEAHLERLRKGRERRAEMIKLKKQEKEEEQRLLQQYRELSLIHI